ncbi:MAG: helicase-related protein, partial [candidate division WOR-3 bacterium]
VTTLTKRMAEDLTSYWQEQGLRVRYLHSEIDAIGRIEILQGLRADECDVIVGVNLLREGLDLPEVSLVAVLDADKEGFLRDARSLIQTAGRAARNVRGEVILYADNITRSIRNALAETERRRQKQIEYNRRHGIIPRSIEKTTEQVLGTTAVADARDAEEAENNWQVAEDGGRMELLLRLEKEMQQAAQNLEFERAAKLRDRIRELRQQIDDEEWRKNRRKWLKNR